VLKRTAQIMLTRVGAHCSPLLMHQLDAVVGYLEAGRWMRERGFSVPHRYRKNQQLWEAPATRASFSSHSVAMLSWWKVIAAGTGARLAPAAPIDIAS
jgi:hypothetical protein